MKNWKKILKALLVPVMALTMCFTASAEESNTDEPKEEVSLVKELKRESDLEIPDLTFTFKFDACEIGEGPESLPAVTESAPLADVSITFDAKSKEPSKEVSLTDQIKEAEVYAGTYAWKVTETDAAGTNTDGIIEYDDSTLYLFAFVTENEETVDDLVWNFLVYKETKEGGKTVYKKQENLIFTNTYLKQVVVEITNKVRKETEDGDAIPDESFTYTADFTKSDTAPMKGDTFYYHVVTKADSEENYDIFAEDTERESGKIGDKLDFNLKDGDKLIIGICAGNTMTLVQNAKYNFQPSVKYGSDREDTNSITEQSGALNSDLEVADVKISGKGLFADFLNIKKDLPITGMIIQVLPFVVLIAAGICILGFFFVSSRRRED